MSPNDRLTRDALLEQDCGAPATPWAEASAEATLDAGAVLPALAGNGFTYRHDWGARNGQWVLRLNWGEVNARSQVFVSIAEGEQGGLQAGKFVGSARYTVHNVAPRAGGVDIWVNIEWPEDIALYVDYLIVNPVVAGPRTVQVVVHRHSSVALSEAEADRILADMGTVLQSDDSGPDVATPVQFARSGAVRVLPANVPAAIQSQADWNALMAAGPGVKIVQAIRWCGGPGDNIIGCAPVGSATVNLAAVRFTASMEGILWVHEYGHNCGLGHRSDDLRAVMYPAIGADHNVVNETESQRYQAGPLTITSEVMPAGACHCDADGIARPADVRDFVTRHWVEGVPYEIASQYTEQDALILIDWLVNEPEQHAEFLPQIVATLGYIGSELAVPPLIGFVQGPLAGRAAFNAKNAALVRMGDLVNRSGNRAAFDFLTMVASGQDASMAGATGPGAELAVSATFGLALAGVDEAQQVLEDLTRDADALTPVREAAVEALGICQTIRTQGRPAWHAARAARHP